MSASLDHLYLQVSDLERSVEFYERLRSEGVPADQEWGARHVWLTDPDGNRLSLFSTREDLA